MIVNGKKRYDIPTDKCKWCGTKEGPFFQFHRDIALKRPKNETGVSCENCDDIERMEWREKWRDDSNE